MSTRFQVGAGEREGMGVRRERMIVPGRRDGAEGNLLTADSPVGELSIGLGVQSFVIALGKCLWFR